MKVLRIIARLNVGGPARHVVWLTEGLTRLGYDTTLVTGVVPAGEDDMSYVATSAGIKPVVLPEMSRELSPLDLVTVWKLYRLMRRERPDLVHTHTAKAGAVGRTAGLMYRWLSPRAKCRFVHTFHGHIFHGYYGPLKTRMFLAIEKLLARMATDRIIVVSHQQQQEINQVFRVGRSEQFSVIPLGLELDEFAGWAERRPLLRAELNATDDEILIGIVGRLTEIKNHKLFLEAAGGYRTRFGNQGPRVRFVIVGDGHLRPELESQAHALQLRNNVVFLGTRNDPENFYPALDIVALTSLNEGTPLTLIEAMANARPVIATAVGGVTDLLGDSKGDGSSRSGFSVCERGLAVKTGDAEAFAEAYARLVQDKSLREFFGARGRDYVFMNHNKDRLLKDIDSLYRELCSETAVEAVSRSNRDVTASSVEHSDPEKRAKLINTRL
jgi:glycosyltransferase involved in cell wall biosynthesis